jgi:beta-galactosidase
MGRWADAVHRKLPRKAIGISEYGAGGSIRQHDDTLRPVVPTSRWHPEGWQTHYHEENWKQLSQRPFIWGKFIWVLADFGSPVRFEGDTTGINDKGLVTYDRQTKKDAFYFYKANWNPEPMVYIADRRHTRRNAQTTSVTGYATLPELELVVNGTVVATQRGDAWHRFVFPRVLLRPGANTVVLRGRSSGRPIQDQVDWWVER